MILTTYRNYAHNERKMIFLNTADQHTFSSVILVGLSITIPLYINSCSFMPSSIFRKPRQVWKVFRDRHFFNFHIMR